MFGCGKLSQRNLVMFLVIQHVELELVTHFREQNVRGQHGMDELHPISEIE